MNCTESSQAVQPSVQPDDSFVADQSFTQPDRPSINENPAYANLFNLLDHDKTSETPKSLCNISILDAVLAMLKDSRDVQHGQFEMESNRSSVLFERSQTHRDKNSENKQNRSAINEDHIRITSIKNLLRLFRSDSDTFELNGQKYLIDLEQNESESPSQQQIQNNMFASMNQMNAFRDIQEKSHDHTAKRNIQNRSSMFNNVVLEDSSLKGSEVFVSPMIFKQGNQSDLHNISVNMLDSNEQDESLLKNIDNRPIQVNLFSQTTNQITINIPNDMQKGQKINKYGIVDFQNNELINSFQSKKNSEPNKEADANSITPILSFSPSLKRAETADKEIQVDENVIKTIEFTDDQSNQNQQAEIKNMAGIPPSITIEEEKKEPEVDDFYAQIARQLALEIELEELEEQEQEQQQKQKELQKNEQIPQPQQNAQQAHHHKIKSDNIESLKFQNTLHQVSDESSYNKKSTQPSGQSPPYNDITRDSMVQSINSDNPKLKRFVSLGDSRQDYRFDKNSKLQQMNSKNLELLEQLNQARLQLESLGQIFIGKNGEQNIAEAPLHLAFLFASPLVMRLNGSKGQNSSDNFNTVPLLEFTKEFKEIRESIKETKRSIKIRAKQATIENLSLILSQNPLALHFSGHGIENNKENFGRQFRQRQNDGNYLLFETEDGEGELVSEKMLQDFIQSSNTKLEFVFVASCYSEFAGRIFVNAGAKHVICVRSGEQIADLAVITFSKSFYNAVFSQTMTICDAFKMAQKQVQVKYGLGESNKFSILINDNQSPDVKAQPKINNLMTNSQNSFKTQGSSQTDSHKCKIFGPLKNGDAEFLELKPRFREYPAKVDNFIGRQKEMFDVISNVINHRLVNIIGLPGIGKTSLSKNAVHYLVDRKIFKQGIVFMQLKGYISLELFMKKLVVNFVMQNFELDLEKKKQIVESNIEQLLQISLNYLKQTEENLLLVFDNVEDLLYHDKKAFRIFINDLLMQVQNVHILMTSRTTLGTLQDIQEKILVLQELSPFYTVELFISRSREIKEEEIKELLEYTPDNQLLVAWNTDNITQSQVCKQKVKNLQEHHLFRIFGGNPHAITLAAPLLIRMKLKELYNLLNSKEMYDVLKVDGIEDSTVASLRLSLEVSVKVLQKEEPEALNFFFFIGMLPGGIEEDELAELWQDFKKPLELLMNFSLIQKKETKANNSVKYILPPFMSNYADAKISMEDKVIFQNLICHYYANICKKIYNSNGKSLKKTEKERTSELNHQVMEKLLKHETNIYACIHRMVDANPSDPANRIQTDFVDGDDDDEFNPLDQLLAAPQNTRLQRLSTLMRNQKGSEYKKSQTQLDREVDEVKRVREGSVYMRNQNQSFANAQRLTNLADNNDSRPFQIMTSQTPRTEDGKHFAFPSDDSKPNNSFLLPGNQVMEDDEEDRGSELSREDDEANEMRFTNVTNINVNHFGPQLNQSVLLDTSYQQDALQQIIRNSIVNFQRQSFNPGLQQLKNPQIERKNLQRRNTVHRTEDLFSKLRNRQNELISKKKAKVEELHPAEQLIIYYGMNLFLLHENESALHLIEELALKGQGCTLYEANLYRIQGLVHHNKTDVELALQSFKKAKKLYTQADSQYGIALSKFSIGYIYRSKITEFITQLSEEVILKRSKANFESALILFKSVNHVVGQALCHQQLSFISKSLQNKQDSNEHAKQHQRLMITYTKYGNKRECPFIARVHGNEISLMSEIVFDNELRDLFPPVNQSKRKTTVNSNIKFGDLQLPTGQTKLAHHSSVQIDPSELMITPQLKLQESMIVNGNESLTPNPKQNLDRQDSLSSFDIAQEQIKILNENLSFYQPKQCSPSKENQMSDSSQTSNTSEGNIVNFTTVVASKEKQQNQNPQMNKQQSLKVSNKITKMISTLDIVEEEEESNRPSTILTIESKRQSIMFQDGSDVSLIKQTSPAIIRPSSESQNQRNTFNFISQSMELGNQNKLLNQYQLLKVEDYDGYYSLASLSQQKLEGGLSQVSHRKKSFDKSRQLIGDDQQDEEYNQQMSSHTDPINSNSGSNLVLNESVSSLKTKLNTQSAKLNLSAQQPSKNKSVIIQNSKGISPARLNKTNPKKIITTVLISPKK